MLSAIPLPDPAYEKNKKLIVYDEKVHDYTEDKPVWVEIRPGHFVSGNQKELAAYREALREEGATYL